MNTKDDDNFSPRVSPISDDEIGFDSYVGRPPSESEGYKSVSPPPNISIEGVKPPNTSPIGDNTQEGADFPRKIDPISGSSKPNPCEIMAAIINLSERS